MSCIEILTHPISEKLISKFKRKCPRKQEYLDRLTDELNLIIAKRFHKHLLFVVKILKLVNDIPHIIRGSSGSSLVCYCLGITNIDPVKENVIFARFLNAKRETMPDIDMDFPYNKRELVFERLHKRWPNKIGRISNHIYFQEKSALRQAIRDTGYNKFISKYQISEDLFPDKKDKIIKRKQELMGTFRCYSLHCGGIVYYKDGIPDDDRLESHTENQIKYNKDDVDEKKFFKVDILSSRGLAVLLDVSNKPIEDYPDKCPEIVDLFKKGNNIGLTFSESPAMRKILSVIRPKNIQDVALALALVRPAAGANSTDGKTDVLAKAALGEYTNFIIYDDDAITYIQRLTNCTDGEADQYRKAFSKNKYKKIDYFKKMIDHFHNKDHICDSLNNLRKYSFCKSHALSYGKLVWALAYQKIHNPKKFWLSVLNHSNSSYKKWVYFAEAKNAGIRLTLGKRPWILKDDKLVSIYENPNSKKKKNNTGSQNITSFFKVKKVKKTNDNKYTTDESINQLKNYGYWISKKFIEGMYLSILSLDEIEESKKKKRIGVKVEFKGLIAAGRCYEGTHKFKNQNQDLVDGEKTKTTKTTFITISYDNGRYIDCVLYGCYSFGYYDYLEGEGYLKNYLDWYHKEKLEKLDKDEYMKTIDFESNALTIDVTNFKFGKL